MGLRCATLNMHNAATFSQSLIDILIVVDRFSGVDSLSSEKRVYKIAIMERTNCKRDSNVKTIVGIDFSHIFPIQFLDNVLS